MNSPQIIALIDQLVGFVQWNETNDAAGDQIELISDLSAKIAAQCVNLGIAMPPVAVKSEHVDRFGFCQIPHLQFLNESTRFLFSVSWKQAMRELRASVIAKISERHDDTKLASEKKYRRPITREAADCARRYKNRKRQDPSVKMKHVISEYVEETGVSKTPKSIMRTLNDHPELWKG